MGNVSPSSVGSRGTTPEYRKNLALLSRAAVSGTMSRFCPRRLPEQCIETEFPRRSDSAAVSPISARADEERSPLPPNNLLDSAPSVGYHGTAQEGG